MRSALRASAVLAALAVLAPRAAAAKDEPAERAWAAERPGYLRLFASGMVGDGLRFNNPYRLATPLGGDAESVSRTAVYGDVGLGLALGRAEGIQHAGVLRTTFALEGIRQVMMTPSYLLWRRWGALAAYGRVGLPVVFDPNPNVGGELGAGGVYFIRGGIGLVGELVGDVFYGAGTRDVSRPVYPLLGAQLGLQVDLEVLP